MKKKVKKKKDKYLDLAEELKKLLNSWQQEALDLYFNQNGAIPH